MQFNVLALFTIALSAASVQAILGPGEVIIGTIKNITETIEGEIGDKHSATSATHIVQSAPINSPTIPKKSKKARAEAFRPMMEKHEDVMPTSNMTSVLRSRIAAKHVRNY